MTTNPVLCKLVAVNSQEDVDGEENGDGEEQEHEEREDADGGARGASSAVAGAVVRGADGVLVLAGVEAAVVLVRRAADGVQFWGTSEKVGTSWQTSFYWRSRQSMADGPTFQIKRFQETQ